MGRDDPAGPADAPDAPPDDAGPDPAGGPAEARAAAPRARRTRRAAPAGKTKPRSLHLPDDIHDRLWLLARKRKTTVSAVAADILDRNLPRLRIESD